MSPHNVLLACSGSVATIKMEKIIQLLQSKLSSVVIRVIYTEHAMHFVQGTLVNSDSVQYYRDRDEWTSWSKMGDDILHIELGKWADVMCICPLSANSLAKIANGICDNLLTCTVRAWDRNKPLIFAPAMNTRMYDHPITRSQIDTLISWGYIEIPAIEKLLACGDKGYGAMAEAETIANIIIDSM